MFRSHRKRANHRYYRLPGMGRSNRRHHRRVLVAAVFVGLAGALLFGALLYWVHGR